jgi:hypothetical protein
VAGGETPGLALSVSVVVYHPDRPLLERTLEGLGAAVRHARRLGVLARSELTVVDNSEDGADAAALGALLVAGGPHDRTAVVSGHGNVGYGRGHNLALDRTQADYHLVLNPDVLLDEDALAEGLGWLESHPGVGLLTPRAEGADGARQYLCKRYPTVIDLLLRGLGWPPLLSRFAGRLDRYEMRAECAEQPLLGVPIASGCFLLGRVEAWRALGGFSPEYFMYFEDFDLSVRAGAVTRIAYVPAVRIVHFGGAAARKGLRHVAMFLVSGVRFFRGNGWKLW